MAGWNTVRPLVQPNDFLFVQPQKRTVHQLGGVSDLALEDQVGLDGLQQLSQSRLGQQVRASASRRQAGEQVVQQTPCGRTSQFGGLLQQRPVALQRHLHGLRIAPTHSKASPTAALAPPVGGDAADDAPQEFRQCVVVPVVLQPLGGEAEMQRERVALFHVRRRLPQEVDKTPLKRRRLLQALRGGPLHPGMDKGRQHGVVAGDAHSLQIVERVAHSLRRQA